MTSKGARRRLLLKTASGLAAAPWLPGLARADTPIRIRQEWQQFKTTSQYQSFLAAFAAMRANTNASDRSSLAYWANVHETHCPHGAPYFIAWHRGYLYYFEQQLRIVSGNPDLNVPYWDYYSYATLPAEFTNPASNNPLYVPRLSANVHSALDLAPFAPTVYNFQHGALNAFEPKIEDVHNPIHDLIGGVMTTMQSPLDPIFYLHHASIDRLTHAWALPDGKGIPYSNNPYSPTNSDPYWGGNHVYAADLSIERYKTLDPTWIGTDYADTTMPTTLPPAPSTSRTETGRTTPATRFTAIRRPPLRSFKPAPNRRLSATRRVVSGVLLPTFDEQSISVVLRLEKKDAAEAARIVAARRGIDKGSRLGSLGSIKVVIDRATVSAAAGQGGFFYAFYLNMPNVIDSSATRALYFVGTLGAFQIAAASHHGAASIEFDVTGLLAQQKRFDFTELSLSWVRVDGDRPPKGKTIDVAEARLDLTFDPQPAPAPALAKPALWYRSRGRGA